MLRNKIYNWWNTGKCVKMTSRGMGRDRLHHGNKVVMHYGVLGTRKKSPIQCRSTASQGVRSQPANRAGFSNKPRADMIPSAPVKLCKSSASWRVNTFPLAMTGMFKASLTILMDSDRLAPEGFGLSCVREQWPKKLRLIQAAWPIQRSFSCPRKF